MRLRELSRRRPVMLLAGQIITALVAFVMNLLSSNVLAPAERGVLAFFLQVSYITTTFSLLGVERPYIAARPFIPFGRALRETGYLTRLSWLGGLALVAIASGFAIYGNVTIASLVLVSGIYMMANVFIRRVRVAYITSGAIKPFVTSTICTQFVLLLGGVVLFLADSSSAVAWLAVYAVS